MNFSGISSQKVFGKLLRLPLRLLPGHLVVPILQGQLKGKKWIVGSSTHGCWLGSYEYEKQQLLAKAIMPDAVVFDIGAHVGFYTLLASNLVGSGRVFAFEPSPGNISYLYQHLRLNDVSNVEVIEAAVTDRIGTTTFEDTAKSSMGHISSSGTRLVKTVALDEWISQGRLPLPELMKIDVEGAELLVLNGARDVLARAHPTIFLATHGEQVHLKCCEMLRSIGYQLQSIGGRSVRETEELVALWHKEAA